MKKIFFFLALAFTCIYTSRSQSFNLVKDINTIPSTKGSDPYLRATIGNTVYFFAKTLTNGFELWKSDGTAAGTLLVKDIYPGTVEK